MAGRDRPEMVRIWTGRGSGVLGEADDGNAVSTSQGPWDSKGPSQVRAGVKLINRRMRMIRLERGPGDSV